MPRSRIVETRTWTRALCRSGTTRFTHGTSVLGGEGLCSMLVFVLGVWCASSIT